MAQIELDNGGFTTLDEIREGLALLENATGNMSVVRHKIIVKALLKHIDALEKRPGPWTVFWEDGITYIVYGATFKAAMDTIPHVRRYRKDISMVVVGTVEKDYDYNPLSRSWSAKLM
jgi:hypothetical protein